jgi:hypothetical protein
LILKDGCPANCLSIKDESLVMHALWKYYLVLVNLTNLADKAVLDVAGNFLNSHGDWNDPDKHKGFSVAVWCILKAHK